MGRRWAHRNGEGRPMTTSEDPQATSKDPEAAGAETTAMGGAPEPESERPTPGENHTPKRRGVMQSLTTLSVRYVERLMPDPYLFAIILTLVVVALVAILVKG